LTGSDVGFKNEPMTDQETFRPSQVALFSRSWAPFIDTFSNTEAEIAMGMIVAALVFNGDEWKPLPLSETKRWFEVEDAKEDGHWHRLFMNPFAKPNFDRLAKDKWIRAVGEEPDPAWEVTEAALKRILEKGWVNAA